MAYKVALVVGSDSDLPVVLDAFSVFDEFGIAYEARVLSAHRAPIEVAEFARSARDKGFGVIIAAAGLAAHLPGVIAAHTTLPVIGLPIKAGALAGQDALYSIVQMPPGVPVASVGIDNARNAALLAVQILAVADPALESKLFNYKTRMRDSVLARDATVREKGVKGYLESKK